MRVHAWLVVAAVMVSPIVLEAEVEGPAPVKVDDYKDVIRVACVGDSITYGAGIKDRDVNSYPAQLGRLLGPKWEVRNFGVSGATMLKKGDRPYNKQKAFADALAFKPNVVVIALGTNDSKPQNWQHKDDFAADCADLVAEFRKADPNVRVYICLPVPAFPGQWGIRDEIIKGEVIPLLRRVAAETKADVIDLYAALSGRKEFFPDTVHPNVEGATVMAATIYKALTGVAPATPKPAASATLRHELRTAA